MENPIKMDDLGVPLFLETPMCFFLGLIWVFPRMVGFPPKWMVKIMENPYEQMDDLGENPLFKETPICANAPKWVIYSYRVKFQIVSIKNHTRLTS